MTRGAFRASIGHWSFAIHHSERSEAVLKFTVERSGRVSRKTWNEAMKAVYHSGAEHWHDRFSARHFTAQRARLYGYAPRSKKYLARKQREKGHGDPLVWSGGRPNPGPLQKGPRHPTGGQR